MTAEGIEQQHVTANRELRRDIFMGYAMRGDNDDEFDNKEILARMAALRAEAAQPNVPRLDVTVDHLVRVGVHQGVTDLLQQKDGFSALDHELFSVMGGHASTALFAARLYSQSERKLNTIQGFIDLLTK